MSDEQTINTGPPSPIEAGEANFALGAVAGLAAAAAGAGAWYGVVIATDTQFGLIAVGIGFLVGFAIKFGAGKNGAFPLQILGAALALLAIVAGEYLIIHHWLRQPPTEFVGWLGLGSFTEVYVEYLKADPLTLLFYGIAVYEGYILPKPDEIVTEAPAE